MQIIYTQNAPAPIGAYSQAVKANGMLYLAGQIALDPQTNALSSSSIEVEVRQIFKNMQAVLAAGNSSFAQVVKLTVYLINLADIAIVNEVMEEYFQGDFPARTAFAVAALPKSANVEIDAIAVCV